MRNIRRKLTSQRQFKAEICLKMELIDFFNLFLKDLLVHIYAHLDKLALSFIELKNMGEKVKNDNQPVP